MPPEIVEPEREMPGNKAKTWKKPIQSVSIQLTESRDLFREPKISAMSKKILVKIRKIAADFGLLKAFSNTCLKNTAVNPAGIVAKIRYQPKRE
jgi:hypothetical protein